MAPNYYAGAQIVLFGSAWTRIKNNLIGTNIVWRSTSAVGGRFNVLEFSKQITARTQDSAGNLLSDGYLYYQPVGENVAGIRAKGITSDITFDLTQQAISTVSGIATSEFVYAWDWASSNTNESTYAYFCKGTTKGSETHTFFSSRYGYDKQSATVSLVGNNAATPTYVHASLPTTDKIIANAAAITGVTFNFTNKVITVTGTLTIQQIYDKYQYELNQIANLQRSNECTVIGSQTRYIGWTIVVNAGAIITTSAAFNFIYADNVTIIDSATMPYLFNAGGVLQSAGVLLPNTVLGVQDTYSGAGLITAVYGSLVGTSTTWQFQGVQVGTSLAIYDAAGNTKYFQGSVATAGTYNFYIPPQAVGEPYTYAIEKYGTKRQEGTFPSNAGGVLFYVPGYNEDVGITQTNQATVAAYTAINNLDKFYDYTAFKRLTEQFIKLGQIATRAGSAIDIANFGLVVKTTNADVESITGTTIFIKSNSLANGTKYNLITATPPKTVVADTTEVITASIEDANGDSSLTIQGGSGNFTLWKITNATPEDDYATGINLGSVGNVTFRFLQAPGFKIVIRDNTTGFRQVCPMNKGIYTRGLFFGDQVQLAQSAEVTQINEKVDLLQADIDQIQANALTAPQVRTELSVELARLDVAVSTRLATVDYVAPANADITAIKTTTDRLIFNGQDHVAVNVHQLQAGAITDIQTGLATTVQLDQTETDIIAAISTSTAPSASTIASAVRTELATELGRVDVAVSTRNAVEPDNTSITAIKSLIPATV